VRKVITVPLGVRSPGPPYLKALLRAIEINADRKMHYPLPAQARPKVWRRAGERFCRTNAVSVFGSLAFPPDVLRGCGCRCHRNHIFAVIAA
jgi:hypothetical protein